MVKNTLMSHQGIYFMLVFLDEHRKFITNLLTLLSSAIISQVLSNLTLLLTARHLGSAKYGQYVSCVTLAGFAAIAVNLGAEIWLLRKGSEKPNLLGEAVGSVLMIKVALGTLWLGVMFLFASLLNPTVFPPTLFRLSALFSWLNSMFATILAGCKASLKNNLTLLLQTVYIILWLLFTGLLLLIQDINVANYMMARLTALLLAFSIGIFIVTRLLFPLRTSEPMIIQIAKETPPFALSEVMAWAYMRIDLLIIAFVLGQQAVGVYAVAENIVNALFFVPAAAYEATVPILKPIMLSSFKYSLKYLLPFKILGFFLFITIALSITVLKNFLGPNFDEFPHILWILSPIPLLHSLVFGFTSIIVAAGRQRERVIVQAGAVTVNIILSIIAARYLGIKGVAAVYTITEFMLLLGYAKIAQRLIWSASRNTLTWDRQ